MIKKNYSKTGKSCRVTFKYIPEKPVRSVSLCGEFNDWNDTKNVLTQRKDGSFSTTISLEAGKDYRFKYLIDSERWEIDHSVDETVRNEYGTIDSVVSV